MSTLVSDLKKEHSTLTALLTEIQKHGVGSEESKNKLLLAKNALLKHLTKEDKELYPVLKRAGETNEDVQRKLNTFGKDMDEITQFVLNFFENVENNAYDKMGYARDFGKLVSVLSGRIRREENILYPLYESCL